LPLVGCERKASILAEADGFVLLSFARRCGGLPRAGGIGAANSRCRFGHIHRHDIVDPNAAYSQCRISQCRPFEDRRSSPAHMCRRSWKSRRPGFHPGVADDDGACPICLSNPAAVDLFHIPDAPRYSPSSELSQTPIASSVISTIASFGDAHRAPFQSRAPPACADGA